MKPQFYYLLASGVPVVDAVPANRATSWKRNNEAIHCKDGSRFSQP